MSLFSIGQLIRMHSFAFFKHRERKSNPKWDLRSVWVCVRACVCAHLGSLSSRVPCPISISLSLLQVQYIIMSRSVQECNFDTFGVDYYPGVIYEAVCMDRPTGENSLFWIILQMWRIYWICSLLWLLHANLCTQWMNCWSMQCLFVPKAPYTHGDLKSLCKARHSFTGSFHACTWTQDRCKNPSIPIFIFTTWWTIGWFCNVLLDIIFQVILDYTTPQLYTMY